MAVVCESSIEQISDSGLCNPSLELDDALLWHLCEGNGRKLMDILLALERSIMYHNSL